MKLILEALNLDKCFSSFSVKNLFKQTIINHALKSISFSLAENNILAILGPNGAGKTTLLRIISTLILPDKGLVRINGYTVGLNDKEIKSVIGLVGCNERNFYWRLNGRQNLEFFAAMYGLDKSKTRSRINELLKVFKVDYADRRFDTYSTGMKRKLSFIRALLHNPKLILLDEPTKSLDHNSIDEIKEYIKKLKNHGKTILFVSHDIEESKKISNEFMILHKGIILGTGRLEELRKQAQEPNFDLAKIYLKLTKDD